MQIQHNIQAINSGRNLAINNSALAKNLEKLSSGYRINRAGDDAAGLAISEQMRSQINGLNQAVTNAQDAIGMIQTAEGALTEVHSMLQRMVTLTTQAANGTMNSTASANIDTEYAALMKEIDRIANYTDFNGTRPLSSKDGTATGAGIAKMTFQIGPSANETIGVESKNLMYSAIVNNKGTGSDYKTSNLTDKTKAAQNLTALNNAINDVAKYRAKLGAAQNRLEHTVNSLKVTSENIQSAESRIRDTNMPDEITAFTKNNILLQAAQSMLSQANAVPQSVLSLLG
ncbi:MAG: flagellin [Lachnospiraceae bacterium]|nr:flagellin [Lachnospiraceae bacterium]